MEMEALSQADPARGVEIDSATLRAEVDRRIGSSVVPPTARSPWGPPWLRAVAAFGLVLAIFAPVALRDRTGEPRPSPMGAPGNLAAVAATIGLEGGGVKTVAVDGDQVWVMNALQGRLDLIASGSEEIVDDYLIDAYVEGVAVGGGYVWLSSYDDGGELLRFDPNAGEVDLVLPTDGAPTKVWFGDRLWMSTEAGVLMELTADGDVISSRPGQVKGTGLGYLWIYDPETRSILALDEDGKEAGHRIPPDTAVLGDRLAEVREVVAVGEHLWLLVGDRGDIPGPMVRFDPVTEELLPVIAGGDGVATFDGWLWVTSQRDHMLARVDPSTGEVETFALPGRPGAVFEADGSLWVPLYQPGVLARLDPSLLPAAGERIVDRTNDGHRLVCTAGSSTPAESPTVLLDPNGWIGLASWSMVQAELAARGITSCAFGSVDEPGAPAERADQMEAALAGAGIDGPFVLAAAVDGVHSTRLFAQERDDVAGVVLVDPIPVGFPAMYDVALPGWGHPPWADLAPELADTLGDFGAVPLVVIGQDPGRSFLNAGFQEGFCCDADGDDVAGVSEETARRLNDSWQRGLDGYAGLSSQGSRVTAVGSGFDAIVWELPELVADEILSVVEASSGGG